MVKDNIIYVPAGGSYVGEGSGGGKGGTYIDKSGQIISAGRGSNVGSSNSNSGYHSGFEEKGYVNIPNSVRNQQETIARNKLGQIRNVVTDNARGERTFIGMNGKRYTFPINDISFSGSNRYGGIASKESMIDIKEGNTIRRYTPQQFETKYNREFQSKINTTLKTQAKLDSISYFEKNNPLIQVNQLPRRDAFKRYSELTRDERQQLTKLSSLSDIVDELPSKPLQGNYSTKTFKGKVNYWSSGIFKGLKEFPASVARGGRNVINAGLKTSNTSLSLLNLIKSANKLSKAAKEYKKQKYSITNKNVLIASAKKFNNLSTKLIRDYKKFKVARNELSSEDTKAFVSTLGLIALGGVGGLAASSTIKVLSLTGKAIEAGLSGFGGYLTLKQGAETIKNPTPENVGRLAFLGIPTALGIKATLKKLGPSFRPMVKNAATVKLALRQKLDGYNLLLKNKKYSSDIKLKIKKEIPKLKKSIADIEKILRDKNVIKSRDFNPKIPSKYLANFKETVLYHVSTVSKVDKLIGQKFLDLYKKGKILPKEEAILAKILSKSEKIVNKKILGSLSTATKLDKIVVQEFKKFGVVVGGGKALNIQSSVLRRRFTSDIDGKVSGKGARTVLNKIAEKANKYYRENIRSPSFFSYENRFKVFEGGHKGTYKLVDMVTKKTLIELTNEAKKVNYVVNKQGLRIATKLDLIKGKANSLSKSERFMRKGNVDIKDVAILTNGKVKARDLFGGKNPEDVFEIIETSSEAGKSRKLFKEFFFFTDKEAALGYSQGKKYSILEQVNRKINRYPKNLRNLIKKANDGKLSLKQSTILRKRLVEYAKKNPGKQLPGTRTSAATMGEREYIQYLGKLKRIAKYTTFDRDLKAFIEVGSMTKNLKAETRIALIRLFEKGKDTYKAYAKNTFMRLKLRLTNPDLIQVRKYQKLLKKEIDLTPKQKIKFSAIVKKLYDRMKSNVKSSMPIGKKAQAIYKDLAKLFDNPKEAAKIMQNKIIPLETYRRKLLKGQNFKDISKVRSEIPLRKLAKREVAEIRRIIQLPRKITDREIARNPQRAILRQLRPLREVIRLPKRAIARASTRSRRTPLRVTTRTSTRTPSRTPSRTPIRTRNPNPRIRTRPNPIKVPTRIKPPVPENDSYTGKRDIVKLAKKKRKFIYIADLLSILYGRVANSRQARALKQVGRLFSGLEERRVIA